MRKFIFISITLIATSCELSFDKKLADFIESSCKSYDVGTCDVSLADFTDFDWDTLYVFGELTSQNEIEEGNKRKLPR